MTRTHNRTARRAAAVVAAALLTAAACSTTNRETHAGATVSSTRAPRARTAVATSSRPGPHADLLRNTLAAHLAAGEFVGARISLLDRDGAITESTAGTTTLDPTSPHVDLATAWNIGSVTKTFVAVVVLQLAEEGKIELDAGIEQYMPGLPGADRITPRQLLQHTSGLNEYINDPAVRSDARRDWSPSALIAVAEAAGRVGEPGGRFHYANTNFLVLGTIIEQVTGHPWDDEVRARILEPLGMTATSVVHDATPGFVAVDGALVDATNNSSPSLGGAAGQLQSTNRDLLRFAAALADGTLLSPASQAAMQSFVPGDDLSQFGVVHSYGLGLERYETGSLTVLGHMGTGETQSAFLGYDTEHHLAIVVTTNTAIAGPQAIMAIEVLSALVEAG